MVIDINSSSAGGAARSTQSNATAARRDVAAERPAAEPRAGGQAADSGVKLSSQAQQLQAIEERLRELPEVDSARVEQIRQAIADGSYKPDSGRIADKLIALES